MPIVYKIDILKALKEKVVEFEDYVIFANKAKKMGLKVPNNNMHMLFRGNPGTGKTTVARIVANILWQLGFLKARNVIETTPRDFIAGYVGQTAIITVNVPENATGNVTIEIDGVKYTTDNITGGKARFEIENFSIPVLILVYCLQSLTRPILEPQQALCILLFCS